MNRSVVKPKNWLVIAFRKWHRWLGVGAGIFILVAGFSGIVLNYKRPILTALGLEKEIEKTKRKPAPSASMGLSTRTGFRAATVSPDRALDLARAEWGDVRLERIELKDEQGQLVYKMKQASGDELWVNAVTGVSFRKREYDKVRLERDGASVAQFDWGKLLLDLHTGKIGGDVGKALMSFAALILLFLTASGVYLWIKPLLIRRANAKVKTCSIGVLKEMPECNPG